MKQVPKIRDWRVVHERDEQGNYAPYLEYEIKGNSFKRKRMWAWGDYCEYPYCDLSLPKPWRGIRILRSSV